MKRRLIQVKGPPAVAPDAEAVRRLELEKRMAVAGTVHLQPRAVTIRGGVKQFARVAAAATETLLLVTDQQFVASDSNLFDADPAVAHVEDETTALAIWIWTRLRALER